MLGKRTIVKGLILAIIAALAAAPWSWGRPVRPVTAAGLALSRFGSRDFQTLFRARENSQAIVVGSQQTGYLGLYAFDEHGNCIAMDDIADLQTRSDLAVQWYSPTNAVYEFEMVNHSSRIARFSFVLR